MKIKPQKHLLLTILVVFVYLKAKIESENFPGTGLVQDDAAQRDVSVDHLDAVVEEGKALANLQKRKNNDVDTFAPHSFILILRK
jgi:hypothetical protein